MSVRLRTYPGFLFLIWSLFLSIPPASAANWTIHAQPTRLVNGGPVLFQVKPSQRVESLRGTWLGHEVSFSFDAKSQTWIALAGVSFETAPGTYAIELTGEPGGGPASGKKISFSRSFTVASGKYPKIQANLCDEGKSTE